MRRKFQYGISILLFAVCLSTLFYVDTLNQDDINNKVVKQTRHLVSEYDSGSIQQNINTPKEFVETVVKENKDLYITFDMLVYSVDNYDNIFQTSPLNSGIRMEFAPPSNLTLLSSVKEGGKYSLHGVELGTFEFDRWYNFEIHVGPDGKVTITVDGELIFDTYIRNLDYQISDICVGRGYNSDRIFHGKLKDFMIEYSLLEKNKNTEIFLGLGKIFLSITCLILAYFILFPKETK